MYVVYSRCVMAGDVETNPRRGGGGGGGGGVLFFAVLYNSLFTILV